MKVQTLLRLLPFLLTATAMCTATAAGKKQKKPAVLLRIAARYDLCGLELQTAATTLHLQFDSSRHHDPSNKGTVYFDRAYIVQGADTLRFVVGEVCDERTDERRDLRAGEAYLPCRIDAEGRKIPVFDVLSMRFPALPQPQEPFTLVIETANGKDRFFGVRTDGRAYRPALKPQRKNHSDRSIALPQLRSAHAVLTGKALGYIDPSMDYAFTSNGQSFTDNCWDFKYQADIQKGTFRLDFDLFYPIRINGEFPQGVPYEIILQPGDSLHVDIDLYARAALMAQGLDAPEATLRSRHRSGRGGCEVADELRSGKHLWREKLFAFRHDSCQAHVADDFDTYTGIKWQEHLARMKEIEGEKLSDDEREFLRLMSENIYLTARNQHFILSKRFAHEVPDSAAMAAFQAQITLRDPHAAELRLPHTLKSLYLVNDTQYYGYFEANGLLPTPVGRWMENYRTAKNALHRINMMQPLRTEKEWQEIDTLYRPLLRGLNDKAEALLRRQNERQSDICSLEGSDATTYLLQILASHAGHAVLMDFWATWCGPCMQGMKEMEAFKAEMGARGVDFVYITDETSPLETWTKQMELHTGSHYRITNKDLKLMNIPDYRGAIPHYVVYDRNGKYVTSFSGWGAGSLEKMREALEKALVQ